MEFTKELLELKDFYKSRVNESYEALDCDFVKLVDQMEDFVNGYRAHLKYCDSYHNLMDKIQEGRIRQSEKNLKKFIEEMNSEEDDEE